MANDDDSTKIYARQYESRKGTKYYWGRFGGFEVRIFRGKEHEGKPSLDVHVRQVEEEPREAEAARQEQGDEQITF